MFLVSLRCGLHLNVGNWEGFDCRMYLRYLLNVVVIGRTLIFHGNLQFCDLYSDIWPTSYKHFNSDHGNSFQTTTNQKRASIESQSDKIPIRIQDELTVEALWMNICVRFNYLHLLRKKIGKWPWNFLFYNGYPDMRLRTRS